MSLQPLHNFVLVRACDPPANFEVPDVIDGDDGGYIRGSQGLPLVYARVEAIGNDAAVKVGDFVIFVNRLDPPDLGGFVGVGVANMPLPDVGDENDDEDNEEDNGDLEGDVVAAQAAITQANPSPEPTLFLVRMPTIIAIDAR